MTDQMELVRRAVDLVPVLQDRAQNTEQLRRIPQETIDELRAAELMRAAQPVRFGGLGLDVSVISSVAAELGRGCGSTAWCYAIWSNLICLVGMFPEQAQVDYWAKSSDTLISTGFNPSQAKLVSVPGGYQLSGRWDFASGCDAASWVLVGGKGPKGTLLLMVPKSDYVIEDTWFVSGLRGTGSKDILVEDIFVPKHRSLLMADMGSAQTPGRWIHDAIHYRSEPCPD